LAPEQERERPPLERLERLPKRGGAARVGDGDVRSFTEQVLHCPKAAAECPEPDHQHALPAKIDRPERPRKSSQAPRRDGGRV
jgi:hypothetical protein